MNKTMKRALSWAVILLTTGVTMAHTRSDTEGNPGVPPGQTSDRTPGRASISNMSRNDWVQIFARQDRHPAPGMGLAVLPSFLGESPRELLLEGGLPGQWVRVELQTQAPWACAESKPLAWAKLDGQGQARIPLGAQGPRMARLHAWVAGPQGSWWPGPRLVLVGSQAADGLENESRPVQTGELLVSEIMKDPSAVADTSGEWVELFNPAWMRQDIQGFTLTDDAGGGTILSNGGQPIWVPGRGYRVLARNGDGTSNGGIVGAHDYATFSLRNGADQVILARPDGTVVDRVSYDDGLVWPDTSGASLQLRPGTESPYQNDGGAFWCEGFEGYGDGDLGTPGEPNGGC
ncbi:MAG: lamin tail domain-containing protein [Planctomycetota bacterium]|nr:lamin tail domain-containing protein [Planctomycetota bacterium]